ncbi:hypothetical protein [Novosphingobium sp.]|uniref:hypothetical protein n=1 Tax=Novosphingobium sp. TaxID=1874826 RepID=UPI0025E74A59|nr:hypothetical protein [Novosphingobium sp.]
MASFRLFLAALVLAIVAYTAGTIAHHGWNLMPMFFGAIAQGAWPGQFNLDFVGLLSLSGLWLAWRHNFSPVGLALGVLGFFGGTPVLATYLLVASVHARGDSRVLVLGPKRAALASPMTADCAA